MRKYHGTWATVAIVLLTACIPLFPKALPILSIAVIVAVLLHYRKVSWPQRKSITRNSFLFFAALFYLLHVIGVLWSSNWDFAMLDLGIKLPLLVFPLLFFAVRVAMVGRRTILMLFILSCCYATGANILRAAYRLFIGSDLTWHQLFISGEFSPYIHPSYFGMYLTIALMLWFVEDIYKKQRISIQWIVPIALMAGIMLSGAKAAWIIGVLLVPAMLVLRWKEPLIRKVLGSLMVLMVIGMGTMYTSSEFVRYRVDEMITSMTGTGQAISDPRDSSAVRLAVWKASNHVIGNNFLIGTGTGDVKDELIEEYNRLGFHYAAKKKLNAHSQYFQTASALGVIGLALFLLMLFVPTYHAIRNGKHGLALFIIIVALNCVVESMFEVQAGVLFIMWIALILTMEE